MRKIKILAIIPLLMLLVSLLTFTAFASSAPITRVYDGANIMNTEEISALENELEQVESECGIAIRVYTTTTYYESESKILSTLGMTSSSDLIVLSIEKTHGTYYYELFAYGAGDKYLSMQDSEYILDDLYSDIKGGRILNGTTAFATMTRDMVAENRVSRKNTFIVSMILIPLIAGGIFAGVNVYRYKKKLKSAIYPISDYAKLNLDYATDNFIGSNVTRTRVSSSSSGGRGGSSGSRGRR